MFHLSYLQSRQLGASPTSINTLHFNSFVRGMSVSVPRSPLAHISNNYSRQLLTNMVDCPCTFCPPTTPHLLAHVSKVKKTAIPKLTFGCSVLPIEESQISVDDGEACGGPGDCNLSKPRVDSSDYLSDGNGGVGLNDSLKFLNDKVRKERMRRMKIGLANKGRVPWNKGRKHTAETRERIRQRTAEALRDPKVKKKMAEHPRCHSDQIKAKISYSLRCVWQQRLKSKRFGELFFLLWGQSIGTAAKKGGSGQEELAWDSYDKIKEQLEFQQIRQAEEKEKEKMMAIVGAKKFIQSWREDIANAAKKGGSGEQELDWDSYGKIQEKMVLLDQLQRTTEKAKAKEVAKIKAEKAARIKAIKKVMLTQKRKDQPERSKAQGNRKSQSYKKTKEEKGALEVTQEFKLGSILTKNHVSNNISNEVAKGDIIYSIFPAHSKLDLEFIRREKMQKDVSLADLIQAARLRKGKLHY